MTTAEIKGLTKPELEALYNVVEQLGSVLRAALRPKPVRRKPEPKKVKGLKRFGNIVPTRVERVDQEFLIQHEKELKFESRNVMLLYYLNQLGAKSFDTLCGLLDAPKPYYRKGRKQYQVKINLAKASLSQKKAFTKLRRTCETDDEAVRVLVQFIKDQKKGKK